MRSLIFVCAMMTSVLAQAQSGKAVTVKKTFSRETAIHIDIQADTAILWALLTNAPDYPRWNSTILSLEGSIEPNGKIRLRSTLDPKRTFKLKVKEFVPGKRLVWGDGKGTRVYTLEVVDATIVRFTMTEKIGGLMFPMYAKYIPPFDASFEQFAADLKKEAEAIQRSRP